MQRFLPTLLILVPLAAGGVSSHVTGGQDDARLSNPEPQERGPCDDPVHRQFDFWIGDWDVSQEFPQPDGSIVRLDARSTVSREMEGCALLERWRGEVQYFWELRALVLGSACGVEAVRDGQAAAQLPALERC
jgi:hypothetical protein